MLASSPGSGPISLALDDTRRAIAEIGIHVAIPQVEWFEDVAVGVDDVIGTGHRKRHEADRYSE
jgi:hypothetical protein